MLLESDGTCRKWGLVGSHRSLEHGLKGNSGILISSSSTIFFPPCFQDANGEKLLEGSHSLIRLVPGPKP